MKDEKKELKTIKELADDLGVSKSYIDKIIRILRLHTKLDKLGNKYVISKEQQNIVKSHIKDTKTKKTRHEQSTTKLDIEVEFLREQLRNKNDELEKMQKLLDQQQQLQLKTQQMLEEKNLLLETVKKRKWWKFF